MCGERFSYFNPHTREGCDDAALDQEVVSEISIHTPVKGVTTAAQTCLRSGINFNPHTREGCDPEQLHGCRFILVFQSTHP